MSKRFQSFCIIHIKNIVYGFILYLFSLFSLIISSNSLCYMVVVTDSLHKLARFNYFKHSPDLVVVGGSSLISS